MKMKNKQLPQALSHNEQGLLTVHSIFDTIQGEGICAGMPAVFIRLTGCNLQCPLCDTDYTSNSKEMSPFEIVKRIAIHANFPNKLVVISGGEPFRQNIIPLVHLLLQERFNVQIETNGTVCLPEIFNTLRVAIVCSPKTPTISKDIITTMEQAPTIVQNVLYFKYIVEADTPLDSNGIPTFALGNKTRSLFFPKNFEHNNIYIQPLDSKNQIENKRNMDAAVAIVRKHGYRLSIQTHKIIGLE